VLVAVACDVKCHSLLADTLELETEPTLEQLPTVQEDGTPVVGWLAGGGNPDGSFVASSLRINSVKNTASLRSLGTAGSGGSSFRRGRTSLRRSSLSLLSSSPSVKSLTSHSFVDPSVSLPEVSPGIDPPFLFGGDVEALGGSASRYYGLGLAVLGGIFFASWPCFADIAKGKSPVSPSTGSITAAAFFAVFVSSAFVISLIVVPIICCKPLDRTEESIRFWPSYCAVPLRGHVFGVLGGLIQGSGTLLTLLASGVLSGAVAVSITRCSPVIAALWGLLVWGEMKGASRKAAMFFGGMVGFYLVAISLLLSAGK